MIPDFYLGQLRCLSQCRNSDERRVLINIFYRDANFIKALKMICRNTVNMVVPLTNQQKDQLKRNASTIHFIATSRSNGKRELLANGGGFIAILLKAMDDLFKNEDSDGQDDTTEMIEDLSEL